jgi:3-deoxy-manno-octulosonate cytidylyltransferase (CMP-KDO synthetase)
MGGRPGVRPVVLIPARLGASRLPGKPMVQIHGEAMIVHVWRRATEADLGPVVVATDHESIRDCILAAGGQAVMTRAIHASGTDRIAEALAMIDPDRRHDVVVNFQGDLPTIAPQVSRMAVALLQDRDLGIGTAVAEISTEAEALSPNVVKMVGSQLAPDRFRALYFTRTRAPWGEGPLYHHIGLYTWRRTVLERFVTLPPSPLELREKLEQLRAIEAGIRIDAVVVDDVPLGVDTPEDLARAQQILTPPHSA